MRRTNDRWRRAWLGIAVCVALGCATGEAGLPNAPLPTLGGAQLWADVAWSDGWRVQRHAWTGHHRLLDDANVRRAWGGEEPCRAVVAEREARRAAEREREREGSEHLVVLLPGLGRTRGSLATLHAALAADGYRVASLAYPSTRGTLDEHAADVARVLDGVRGVERVSFVTHSLGGRVVQRLLARDDAWRRRIDVGRVVQIAPPNRGSRLGRLASGAPPLTWLMGPALAEVAEPEPEPEAEAGGAERYVPFGVIAGVRGTPHGWNPLLPGDDDGVVSLDETRLAGPHARLCVRGLHTFLMDDAAVVAATRGFLTSGTFGM